MADIYSKSKRSAIMFKISGIDTKPEVLVRKYLFNKGFRYRKNLKSLPGKPDMVLKKFNSVIFIHGCFWHGHTCKASKLPKTRQEFWKNKIMNNKIRDKKNDKILKSLGWNIIHIWQCELKSNKLFIARMEKVVAKLNNILT